MSKAKKRMALLVVIALLVTLVMPMTAFAVTETGVATPKSATIIDGSADTVQLNAKFEGASVAGGVKIQWTQSEDGATYAAFNAAGGTAAANVIELALTVDQGSMKAGDKKYFRASLIEDGKTYPDGEIAVTNPVMLEILPSATPKVGKAAFSGDAAIGGSVTVEVGVTYPPAGTYDVQYQWEVSKDGGKTWKAAEDANKYSGYDTHQMIIRQIAFAEKGDQYRCVVSTLDKVTGKALASETSEAAEMNVNPPVNTPTVTIETEPKDAGGTVTVGEGKAFSLTAKAESNNVNSSFSYQWQRKAKDANSAFEDITGATDETYTVSSASLDDQDAQYRCVVTNTVDKNEYVTESTAITMAVTKQTGAVSFVKQPKADNETNVGAAVEFIAEAETDNGDPVMYQWQVAGPGSTPVWKDITDNASAKTAKLHVENVTLPMNGNQYRCVAKNALELEPWETAQTVTSGIAKLTVKKLSHDIVEAEGFVWTNDSTVISGDDLTLKVDVTTAAGDALSYQWQVMDQGAYRDIAGATSAEYKIPAVSLSDEGKQYKCIVKNMDAKVADKAFETTLTVWDANKVATITRQPQSVEYRVGDDAKHLQISATAPDGQALSYQWESRTLFDPDTDTWIDGAWAPVANATLPYLEVGSGKAYVTEYRCTVTVDDAANGEEVVSEIAKVTAYADNIPYILENLPTEALGYAGQTYTFTVDATVQPSKELYYIWTKDGDIVKEGAGAANASYTTPILGLNDDGAQFQCEVRNAAMYNESKKNAVKSAVSTLTVKESTLAPALPGDLNGNGRVDIEDITTAVDAMNKVITLNAEQLAIVDLNGNGRVDIEDITGMVDLMNARS